MKVVERISQAVRKKRERDEALSNAIEFTAEAKKTYCLIPIGFGRLCPGTVENPEKHRCVQYMVTPDEVHPPIYKEKS